MKSDHYFYPSIVDMAHEVIEMHKENIFLRQELGHYKELHKLNCETINNSIKHGNEMTRTILLAVFDPDSTINKGHEAILRDQLRQE